MQRSWLYFLLIITPVSACSQGSKWSKEKIDANLREIFPVATTINIIDSVNSMKNVADSFNMPLSSYRGIITERNDSNSVFIFYFYNVSILDSAFSQIFRQVMLQDLKVKLGTTRMEYIFSMPQFDKTGKKLLVYAVSANIPDNYDISTKEKSIRKLFDLAETKIKDIKLEELKDNKR
jgi:hypothetical protein